MTPGDERMAEDSSPMLLRWWIFASILYATCSILPYLAVQSVAVRDWLLKICPEYFMELSAGKLVPLGGNADPGKMLEAYRAWSQYCGWRYPIESEWLLFVYFHVSGVGLLSGPICIVMAILRRIGSRRAMKLSSCFAGFLFVYSLVFLGSVCVTFLTADVAAPRRISNWEVVTYGVLLTVIGGGVLLFLDWLRSNGHAVRTVLWIPLCLSAGGSLFVFSWTAHVTQIGLITSDYAVLGIQMVGVTTSVTMLILACWYDVLRQRVERPSLTRTSSGRPEGQ